MIALAGVLALLAQAPEAPPPAPTLPGPDGAPVHEGWLAGAGDVRLFYRKVGAGSKVIVYVHGGPGTGMREGHDLEALAQDGYTLVMYDQRGAGHSTLVSDPARLTIESHVEDLEAVRRHFGLERLDAIGLSWGAGLVARYAAAHAQRTGRIVFLSPMSPTYDYLAQRLAHLAALSGQAAPGDPLTLLRQGAERAKTARDEQLAASCRQEWSGYVRLYERGGPQARKPRADACDYPPSVLRNRAILRLAGIDSLGPRYDLRPGLSRVREPALVVEGRESQVPLDATREWAKALPDGRLLLIPEAGHRNWLDQPDRVASALRTFFAGHWPPDAQPVH